MRKARSFVLEFTRTETPEDPHAFRFVPQDYTLHVDGRLSGRLRFPWDQALLAELVAVRRPGRDPGDLQRLGERLRDVLDPAGWRTVGEEIARTLDAHRAVSVTVRSNAAELFALPWELLTVGSSGEHLGERSQVLVRYEWPGTATREGPSPRPEGGRVVVAWSAAGGPVPADAHLKAIATACERGHVEFDPARDVVGHCDLERLAAALDGGDGRPPATILHWLCHGGAVGSTFGLVINDPEGNPCTVDAGRVRQILAPRAENLRLVVLAACDGGNAGEPGNHLGSVAQAIHRVGIASVVASRYPLSSDGSEVLAAELYHALFVDLCALETAFLRARVSLAEDPTHFDWASLTLHARAGDGEDTRPYIFRPYRGLLAFQGEHNRYFFGREAERQELFDDLRALVDANKPRFMVVAGASGTGKSSMVLAGVVPTLAVDADVVDDAALNLLARMRQDLEAVARRQPGGFAQEVLTVLDREATTRRRRGAWRCKIFRPGTHPLDSLDAAVGGHDGGRLLLVVDQFEEIFTLTDDHEVRQRFARRLWSLAQGATGIHVVLTIRVDFLGHCGHLILDDTGTRLDRIAYDEAHRVFVAQMGDAQLRAAIERPAALVGLKLAAGLVDQIISAGREPGALPLIQYALDRLWLERHNRVIGSPPVDGDATNVVLNALKRWADQVIDGLDPTELALARRLLTRLVDLSDDDHANTRRRVALATLQPRDAAARGSFAGLIHKLVEARLLVISNDAGTPTIEVAHEALIRRWARMREWLAEDRGKLGELKTLDGWVRECDERGALLYGERLGYATEVVARYPEDVSARARALVDASRRRAKLRQGAVLGVAALFVVLGVVALFLGEAARRHEEEARRARLVAEIRAVLASAAEADARESAVEARAAEADAEVSARRARDGARVAAANGLRETALSIGFLREIEAVDPDAQVDGWSSAALAALDRPWIERVRLVGHEGMVLEARFSTDGARVVTASSDRHAFVWDAHDGAKIAALGPHGDAVLSAALSSDGARAVTTSRDGLARLWEIGDPARTIVLTPPADDAGASPEGAGPEGTEEPPRRQAPIASFSPNAARVIAVDDRGVGSLWGLPDEPHRVAWESPSTLTSAAFSPDSARLLTGHDDNRARLWDASTAALLVTLPPSGEPYLWVGFDGERGVTATSDGVVTIWDLTRGRSLQEIKAFESLGPAGDEERLLVGSAAASLVADAGGGCRLILPTREDVVVWSRRPGDATFHLSPPLPIAGGHQEGALPRYDANEDLLAALAPESDELPETPLILDDQGVVRLVGHRRPVRSFDFAEGPTRLVTASEDASARIWTRALPPPQSPSGLPEDHELLALSPDGRFLASRAKGRDPVTIREIGGGEHEPVEVSAGGDPRVVYRPGGEQVAIADAGATIVDLRTRSVLRVIGERDEEGAYDPVIHATYSDDGARLLLDAKHEVTVWDPDTGERLNRMATRARSDSRRGVLRSFFDLPRSKIHTILTDKHIASWNPANESEIALHPIEFGIPRGVTFAAHAQLLVVLTLEAQIVVVQPDDGRQRATLLASDAALMALDPAGRLVAGAETSGVIRVWDLDTMDEIAVLRRAGAGGDKIDAEVQHLAFSPDGRRLLSARKDGATRLWDVASGRLLVALRRGAVGALGFTAAGEEALVLGTDGALTRIPLASGRLLERLWRATCVCPSTDDRIEHTQSDQATADRERERCEAMLRCLQPAEAAPFDRCFAAFRRAQATGEPFDPK